MCCSTFVSCVVCVLCMICASLLCIFQYMFMNLLWTCVFFEWYFHYFFCEPVVCVSAFLVCVLCVCVSCTACVSCLCVSNALVYELAECFFCISCVCCVCVGVCSVFVLCVVCVLCMVCVVFLYIAPPPPRAQEIMNIANPTHCCNEPPPLPPR